MKSKDGFVQAYNAQIAVDGQAQVIVAQDVTQSGVDSGQLVPMTDAIEIKARPRAPENRDFRGKYLCPTQSREPTLPMIAPADRLAPALAPTLRSGDHVITRVDTFAHEGRPEWLRSRPRRRLGRTGQIRRRCRVNSWGVQVPTYARARQIE